MATRIADIWTCSNCHNLQSKDNLWFDGDVCEVCYEKFREKSEVRWHQQLEIMKGLIEKAPTAIQKDCFHVFKIIPKSGSRFGIKLWLCDNCTKVVQSS